MVFTELTPRRSRRLAQLSPSNIESFTAYHDDGVPTIQITDMSYESDQAFSKPGVTGETIDDALASLVAEISSSKATESEVDEPSFVLATTPTTQRKRPSSSRKPRKPRQALRRLSTSTADNTNRKDGAVKARQMYLKEQEEKKAKRLRKVEAMHTLQTEGIEIFENVYLGGKKAAANEEKMRERNVLSIVNATKDIKCYFEEPEKEIGRSEAKVTVESTSEKENGEKSVGAAESSLPMPDILEPHIARYLRISVDDEQEEDIYSHLDEAADFINGELEYFRAQDLSGSVFVHCRMGQSRSPSMLVAYAMKHLGWSLRKTYAHLISLHANLKINDGFKRQLMEYEKHLTGKTTLDFFARKKRRKSTVNYNLDEMFLRSSLAADLTPRGSPQRSLR